jgi:uncharacterized membrane protein YvlD (DUF360 family)
LRIDGPAPLLLAALLLLALDSCSDVVLHWLLVAWPIFVAQTLGLVVQFVAIVVLGTRRAGSGVDGPSTAIWAAVLLTVLNSLFAELVAVSDDDSYYGVLVRRLVARDFRSPGTKAGAARSPDRRAEPSGPQPVDRAGRVPVLGRLMRDGDATLHPWIAMLPPTTPGQSGGHPARSQRRHRRLSLVREGRRQADGGQPSRRRRRDRPSRQRRRGFLADDGASIGNLVTGDAPRSYLTMATIARARRRTTIGACAASSSPPSTTSACWC